MKSIRCVFGRHFNPGTDESRLTFRCGRCGAVRLRSVSELLVELDHYLAAQRDVEAWGGKP